MRNGRAQARKLTVGAGTVRIEAPRINDKRLVNGERQRFTSKILPPYLRRSPKVDYVVTRVLEAREAGVALKRQAVLFLDGETTSPSAAAEWSHNLGARRHDIGWSSTPSWWRFMEDGRPNFEGPSAAAALIVCPKLGRLGGRKPPENGAVAIS